MLIEIEGKQFTLYWQHVMEPVVTAFLVDGDLNDVMPNKGATSCSVYDGKVLYKEHSGRKSEDLLIGRGVALCSVKDQFNRKVGRKVSLGRALGKNIDKGTREKIWKAVLKEWNVTK